MINGDKLALGYLDFFIFGLMLMVSSGIGLYYQMVNKNTNDEYLLAGRNMGIFPVAFSLMATFMAATTLMGIPAEMYSYGTNMAFMNVGFILGPVTAAYVFIPIFVDNQFTTSFEYLEKRFGLLIRRVLSGFYSLQVVLFTSAVLYAPALALSAVTNLSMWISIVSTGIVCTFYSTLGGMKAVIWADVFQAILMYICIIAVSIKGCILLGGIFNIFKINYDGGRLIFPELSLNLTAHYTLPSILMQGLIVTLSCYGGGQMQIQRLLTVKTLKNSQLATFLSIPMLVTFQLLCCFCGFIIYAYFRDCDPLSAPNKPINSSDQLLPYFVAITMSNVPGLAGLCISGIFSASLSTVSSALNSLASVTVEDFFKPLFQKSFPVWVTKIISLFFGGLCVGFAFTMASLGNLIRMMVLIVSVVGGPQVAIFTLAACTRAANQEGALLGTVAGIGLASYLSFVLDRKIDPFLPLSNECPLIALSTSETVTISDNCTKTEYIQSEQPFQIAYMWISTLAFLTTLIFGYISSVVIKFIKGSSINSDVPDKYLSPVRIRFSRRRSIPVTDAKSSKADDINVVTSIM